MRILELSALPVWAMKGGGGMPSLRETLRGHMAAGFDVTLVLPRYHLFAPDLEELSVPEDCGFELHFAPCGWFPAMHAIRTGCKRLGGGGELPFPVRWILNLLTFLLLTVSMLAVAAKLYYRRRRRFDLVYAHNQYAVLAGRLAGRMMGVPNVNRLYGTFLADLMRRPLVTLRYPVAAAGYRVPHDLLICTNDGTRGDVVARQLRIDLSRFRFWQNGVDFAEAPAEARREDFVRRFPAARADAKWAVSCSRLSYWKRIDRMLEALTVCRDGGADCQLLIAGDGPESSRLADLAKDLGVSDHVLWLGPVPHDDIWGLMHVADVFLITNDVTNRCNPLYEAISAGLPVVSVRDPSTEDLLSDDVNALLSDRDDTNDLGESLLRVCKDASLAGRLRAAQAERANTFWSWPERMQEEVKELAWLVEEQRGFVRMDGPGPDPNVEA